ncbi:Transcription factor, fungi [Penicillium expansum]|uniref:Transcription factor, fungi n=1 Tax=Penicillium expansum TaxID=27334 RepID=A0A0A2KTK5_PENEN|nr:Transcription factor, fungi [Penicillium expansum]KGO62951.1 Transcription factor, fungi [Penicillium expansum]KGO71114.1 Transcription factor, fungi [Penicillium expansum]
MPAIVGSLLEREVQKLGAQKIAADVPVGSLEDQDIEESPESSSTVAPWPSKTPASVEAEAEEEGKEEGTGIHGGQIILEPDPDTSESTLGHQFGRLVINRSSGTSRYVNHRVLTDLGDQIKELRDAFKAPSSPTPSSEEEYPSSPGSTAAYSETHSPFIFGYRSSVSSLHEYRPSPTLSQLLLNVFEENIAPIIMIIHKPALRSLIQASWENPEELDRSSEALIFSVYFAAVSSMTPEECLIQLGEDHAIVVKRYRFAVEQALARAGFFHTHKLLVLQAAVLFLTCACNPEDTQFVWTMIAVVTRLGLGLGLHRDGTHFGLSPYETEMRRRVWWYIYLLDVQTCELEATSPQIREGDYDTRLPLNINDNDLSPHSVETPPERIGFTQMTLTLVRCEILISRRKSMQMTCPGPNGPNILFKNRNLAIEKSKRLLEERYLQFCDLSIPIHWVVATIARVALARLWLVSHFSLLTAQGFEANNWPERCEVLILTAIEVLEFVYLLETNVNTAKWSWLFQGYVQWQAFAFVLSELCVRPGSSFSDRAWTAVDRVWERWNKIRTHKDWLIMRPLERLMKRASATRTRQLIGSELAPPIESNLTDMELADSAMMDQLDDLPGDLMAVDAASLDLFRDVMTNLGL